MKGSILERLLKIPFSYFVTNIACYHRDTEIISPKLKLDMKLYSRINPVFNTPTFSDEM